jgi:hypothetical protein
MEADHRKPPGSSNRCHSLSPYTAFGSYASRKSMAGPALPAHMEDKVLHGTSESIDGDMLPEALNTSARRSAGASP